MMSTMRKHRPGIFLVLVLIVITVATMAVYSFTELMLAYDDSAYLTGDLVQARVTYPFFPLALFFMGFRRDFLRIASKDIFYLNFTLLSSGISCPLYYLYYEKKEAGNDP